jgi:hypothetical protein
VDAASQDRLRDLILQAYARFEESQTLSASDGDGWSGRGSVDIGEAGVSASQ